ncbi:MAG: hypothetical protein LH654_05645 [Thermoleophilia bacterium]|nr:hypothetical protein [Thermoleophilia bacterium]
MRARRVIAALAVALFAASAGMGLEAAGAADECKGLRVCLPVAGPWVVVPAGGVEYELACPLPGYVVAGTDARVATRDVDVIFRAETGSPVGPGVSTRRSVVFQAARTVPAAGPSSFRPFIGCIPTRGGGGRALTSMAARPSGLKPGQPVRSIVVQRRVRSRAFAVRAACPSGSRLIGSTHAVAFTQKLAPSEAMLGAVAVRRVVSDRAVVARVTATAAAGSRAEVQVRALCVRAP